MAQYHMSVAWRIQIFSELSIFFPILTHLPTNKRVMTNPSAILYEHSKLGFYQFLKNFHIVGTVVVVDNFHSDNFYTILIIIRLIII